MNELTNPQTVSFLERATRDPEIDVSKLERIIDLQERQIAREAKRQFDEAMNALQGEMPQVLKDRANPHTRSRYATYEEVDRTIRPYYAKHGFSVRFALEMKGDRIRVGCVVSRNGHSETCELESGLDTAGTGGRANKTDVQGAGSIVSYLKRYTIMAAFAVAVQDDETDDDGEGARRAAAATMTRPARKVADEQAEVYDPAETPHDRFMAKLRQAMNDTTTREEAEAVGERDGVRNYMAKATEAQRRDIAAVLANGYGRHVTPETRETPDDLEIEGEAYLAAGG